MKRHPPHQHATRLAISHAAGRTSMQASNNCVQINEGVRLSFCIYVSALMPENVFMQLEISASLVHICY